MKHIVLKNLIKLKILLLLIVLLLAGSSAYALTIKKIPLNLSNELPDGITYAWVTLELMENACTGSYDGVRITVEAIEDAFGSIGTNFGIQRFGFNYYGDLQALTIKIQNDPDGAWTVGTYQNTSEFGVFIEDTSGTGKTRQNPLVLEICSSSGDLAIDDFTIPNDDGYVFVAHIADFEFNGTDETSAYFSFLSTFAEEIIFNAQAGNGKAILSWTAVSEEDVLGYNILRMDGLFGNYEQINDHMIIAKGSIETTVDYQFSDTEPENGRIYFYKLVELGTEGDQQEHGPIMVLPGMFYNIFEIFLSLLKN